MWSIPYTGVKHTPYVLAHPGCGDAQIPLLEKLCTPPVPAAPRRIEETIAELAHAMTIVIVTHNIQQAVRVSQQCAFFLAEEGAPGVIVESDTTEKVFGDPVDPRTRDYVNGRFG